MLFLCSLLLSLFGAKICKPTPISFLEPTCLSVSTRTRSSGIINFQRPNLVPRGPFCHALEIGTPGKVHSRPQSLRSFWPDAGIESSGSNHFEIIKEITEFCSSGLTQSSSMAHARNGCSQSSRFLPQARRIVGSGDENGPGPTTFWF